MLMIITPLKASSVLAHGELAVWKFSLAHPQGASGCNGRLLVVMADCCL